MIKRKLSVLCAASSLVVLTACSAGQSPSSPAVSNASTSSSDSTLVSSAVDRAMEKVNTELATRNIRVSANIKLTRQRTEPTPVFTTLPR